MSKSEGAEGAMTAVHAAEGGLHVGIIMDGNGRWAAARGLSRTAGHRRGADAVRRAVEAAPALGIGTLTLYAFSSDNWARPTPEVRALFGLFRRYLRSEAAALAENDVRLKVVGRRDRLPPGVLAAVQAAEAATSEGRRMRLRVAVDYSARDAIAAAAGRVAGKGAVTRERFAEALGQVLNDEGPVRDLDLLIRTGGEQRLSDFMLWESAYAELVFTDGMWPDFDAADLRAALDEFQHRERRFGRVLRAG